MCLPWGILFENFLADFVKGKVRTFLVVAFLGLQAQSGRVWQVGAQLGLNIPAYRTNKPVEEATIMPGFTGGLVLRYALGSRWALQSGLYFSQ